METFAITHIAPDGELLESGQVTSSQLSEKWLRVCDSLLIGGPIVSTSMGSSLSHWHIECTAGYFALKVHGQTAYVGVLLSASNDQGDQLLQIFEERTSVSVISLDLDARPHFLVLNAFPPGVSQEENHAMFQFAYHFASAYFRWCASNPSLERP